MNSGPSARIRSIRSSKFCNPLESVVSWTHRHSFDTNLSSSRWKVLERPPGLPIFGRLIYFLAYFHVGYVVHYNKEVGEG
jgi:hypothetical protein